MANIHIHAPLCLAAGAILPPLCAGLVALRFYARRQQGNRFGIDDWLTIPALLLVIGMCAATLTGVAHHSVGYTTPPIPPGKSLLTTSSYEQSTTRSVYWSIELMQIPALAAIKASFVYFYRRIFNKGHERVFGYMTAIMLGFILMWGIGCFFSFVFICPGHPTAYWTTYIEEKQYCVDTVTLHNAYGVSDAVLDIIVILLPIPWIWRLHMNTTHKFAIIGIFGLGAFTVVASIFRMITYLQSTAVQFDKSTDTDILITGGIYWSIVECGVGLISCCLPTAYSVFRNKALKSTRLTSLNSRKLPHNSRNSWTGHNLARGLKGGLDRHWNDSQASNIELAGRLPGQTQTTTKANASADVESCGAGPRDQILVTKTFGAEQQPMSGEIW